MAKAADVDSSVDSAALTAVDLDCCRTVRQKPREDLG